MLTIVDYGVGNLASIQNMYRKIGIEVLISSKKTDIAAAEKLILPGVGAFDACAEKLIESGLTDLLNKKALDEKTPVLGICVGMQLLLDSSEEGTQKGLGWIGGKNIKFIAAMMDGLKVPHMGWTDTQPVKETPLFDNMYEEPRFYFVHSYHASVNNEENILLTAKYGYEFPAGIRKDNIIGVQFHPEKSHKYGMKLLENFAKNFGV